MNVSIFINTLTCKLTLFQNRRDDRLYMSYTYPEGEFILSDVLNFIDKFSLSVLLTRRTKNKKNAFHAIRYIV